MAPLVIENPQALGQFVGREIGLSDWLQISQERIAQFAAATEDRQWIHLDGDRASAESPYRTTIAHGFLTLSLVSYFLKGVLEIAEGVRLTVNYGLNRVRFPAPVKVGSRIRARVVLVAFGQGDEFLEATYSMTIGTEGSDKPNCVAEWIVRYYQ
jgi:acyl dehydratase